MISFVLFAFSVVKFIGLTSWLAGHFTKFFPRHSHPQRGISNSFENLLTSFPFRRWILANKEIPPFTLWENFVDFSGLSSGQHNPFLGI
jgi:hypothetical protein